MNFYDFKAKDIDGEMVSMEEFKGQVVLVVNTASKCGFTPQFAELEELYKKYKDEGLVILGFPCNQFANQDPGTDAEIKTFCMQNYGVSFPMFSKVKVNGDDALPLFKFLKDEQGGSVGSFIKWNFTKFLISRTGEVVDRFAPNTTPEEIEPEIQAELKK